MIRSDTLFRLGVVALLVGAAAWLRWEPQEKIHVAPESIVGRTLQGQSAPDTALETSDAIGGGLGNRYVNEFLVKRAGGSEAAKPAQ
ncbi:hypothetical protein [Xanthobacter aminoxidans]|uniref:hypothetical protein n=1 Tax=Xanthobacter aminoxidans TaxID=186280 RepID=UPI002022F545|nr:hypothetical protein [Xanthobacter aminoxidans]MCL8385796.1 hypothetical protein [Xanthobacter aminoxidans]